MTCLTSQSSFSNHLHISTFFEPHPLCRSPFHIIPCLWLPQSLIAIPIPRLTSVSFVLVLTLQFITRAMTRADIFTILLYHNFFVVFDIRIQVVFSS